MRFLAYIVAGIIIVVLLIRAFIAYLLMPDYHDD